MCIYVIRLTSLIILVFPFLSFAFLAESLRSVSTRPQTSLRALLSSHQLALGPVRSLLAQQDTAARLLHGAASNKQRLLEIATRDKEQLVKALVVEQAKVSPSRLTMPIHLPLTLTLTDSTPPYPTIPYPSIPYLTLRCLRFVFSLSCMYRW